ncbi:hypothetical protein [Arthrobacter sp. C152]
MSTFVKKFPRAKVSRHATLDGWVIDLIQRETAKPKRVAATYASIAWAHRAAHVKLGIPVPATTPAAPAPVRAVPAEVLPPKPAPKPRATKDYGICKPCGRPMRPAGSKAADYPGTTLRQRDDLCQSCCQTQKREHETKKKHANGETVVEDVEFLAGTGAGRDEISERIGLPWETIARALYRRGRHDLIAKVPPADPDKAEAVRKALAA